MKLIRCQKKQRKPMNSNSLYCLQGCFHSKNTFETNYDKLAFLRFQNMISQLLIRLYPSKPKIAAQIKRQKT